MPADAIGTIMAATADAHQTRRLTTARSQAAEVRAPISHLLRRRTQAERSGETRERLLKAAVDVLADRGYSGFTVAEVATRAGVSGGARVHHYRSKADLTLAATEYAYANAIENGRSIAQGAEALKDPLGAFINDAKSIYLGRHFIVSSEVIFGTRTSPDVLAKVAAIIEGYRQSMNSLWLVAFEKTGVRKSVASEVMESTLFLIRGMAINAVWQRDLPRYDAVLKKWKRNADALLETGRARRPAKAAKQ